MVGFTSTEDVQHAITKLPAKAWTPAYDAGGVQRDGAWVAELTGLLDLTGWPKGMRVIVRKERPHPGAQLRFTDSAVTASPCSRPAPRAASWLTWNYGTAWRGVRRARTTRTTIGDPAARRPPDLVHRNFTAATPGELHVADFTYVPMTSGFGYTALVIDAFAGRITCSPPPVEPSAVPSRLDRLPQL